jgi:uncharacterized protein YtpQ (UPF0354 family)
MGVVGARPMKLLLAVLIAVVAWCGVASADKLAPRAFTEELARALTAALPSTKVTIKGELRLELSDPDGRQRTILLSNTYQDYSRDPTQLGEVVQALLAALSRPPAGQAKLERSRIIPVIKDRPWLTGLHSGLKARGADQEHLAEDFNEQLVIVYAEDDPARMRYLTTKEDIGVDRWELRALAVDNLRRILPKIEVRGDGKVFVVSAGGDYEASLLLLDEIWSGGQIKVDGDIVVAVPARDVLLVTGSRDRTGLKRVRELAADFVAKGPYALIDTLFVYRNGRFTKFGR